MGDDETYLRRGKVLCVHLQPPSSLLVSRLNARPRNVSRAAPSSERASQYLLGALVLKFETSCCTRDLPHSGHFGGRFFSRSCSLIGTLTSKCLPHALHSNS